jgi:hypothetical protein
MEYPEVGKLLEIAFSKLGFKKGKHKGWMLQLKEITIVLEFKVQTIEKDFYVDLGIVFNRLKKRSWRNATLYDFHLIEGLYNILADLGNSHKHLDRLFSYHPAINSDVEIIDNISDIQELYKTEVIPYLGNFNNYSFLSANFDKKIKWYQFLLDYLPETAFHSKLFKEQFSLLLKQELL